MTVNAAALARSLQQPIADLSAALADVGREVREAQLTLKARNDAVASCNGVDQGVADAVTGIFELVRRGDLADLVRPTAPRRRAH